MAVIFRGRTGNGVGQIISNSVTRPCIIIILGEVGSCAVYKEGSFSFSKEYGKIRNEDSIVVHHSLCFP